MDELQKAFPNNLNPDCGSKQIFMTKRDIMEHVSNGEDWYETGRGYQCGRKSIGAAVFTAALALYHKHVAVLHPDECIPMNAFLPG